MTLRRRAIRRQNILQAHRSHLDQRLVRRGYSHGQVSLHLKNSHREKKQ